MDDAFNMSLRKFLKQVGVYVGGSSFGENDSFETQVVVDGEDAYLEVIVG